MSAYYNAACLCFFYDACHNCRNVPLFVLNQIRAFYNILFSDLKRAKNALSPDMMKGIGWIQALMILVAILEVANIYVITFFATTVGYPAAIKQSSIFIRLVAFFPTLAPYLNDERIIIFLAACLIILFVIFKNVGTAASMWVSAMFAENISRHVSNGIMQRFLRKPYIWQISAQSANTYQAMNFRTGLSSLMTSVLLLQSYVLVTIFLIGIMFYISPILTIVVYASMGVTAYFTYTSIKMQSSRAGQDMADAMSSENSAIMNALKGIREVIIYRQQNTFLDKLVQASEKVANPRCKTAVLPIIPSLALELMGFVIMAVVVLALVVIWDAELPTIIEIVFMLMLTSWRVLPTLNRCVSLLVTIRGIRPTAMQCLEMLEVFNAEDLPEDPVPDQNFSIETGFTLENASFRYPNMGHDSIVDVTCTVGKGSTIGFIGASGAGKSTMSLLLCGLFAPSSGAFLINGKVPSPEELAAYRSKIGFVPQSPYIMSGTIAENIAFSEWGKPYDKERVMRSCKLAAIDFIDERQNGILTKLGENGAGISGGQAQRIAIARALYSEPEVLIFDEATSALDHVNENLIKQTIYYALQSKITCIIIAHRLTTVESCDYIYWMDKGRIVDEGPPDIILPKYTGTLS